VRLLKWIFHPVYLLIIILAVVIFINRTALFSDTTHSGEVKNVVDKVDSLINSMQVEPQNSVTGDTGSVQSVVGDDASGSDFPSQNIAIPDKQNTIRSETVVSAVENSTTARDEVNVQPNVDTGKKDEAESIDTLTNALEASRAVNPESKESDVTNESHDDDLATYLQEGSKPGISDESVTDTHNGPAQPFPAVSREQLLRTWQQARIAAWYGDFESAIEYYQTVIALQPDNYDAYGEMGNVMLRAGNRDGAAEAYYQAALLLNNTPYRSMAWHLLNVLAWLSPARAEKLHRELLQP